MEPTEEKQPEGRTNSFSEPKPATDFAQKGVIQPSRVQKAQIEEPKVKIAER